MTPAAAVAEARRLLAEPAPARSRPWAALGAAALMATGAVTLAGAVVLGPGVELRHASTASPPD